MKEGNQPYVQIQRNPKESKAIPCSTLGGEKSKGILSGPHPFSEGSTGARGWRVAGGAAGDLRGGPAPRAAGLPGPRARAPKAYARARAWPSGRGWRSLGRNKNGNPRQLLPRGHPMLAMSLDPNANPPECMENTSVG